MNVSVAIVGAGVSGLKAAHTLLNHPKSPFAPNHIVVLEAQNRIGGRILTDRAQSKIGYSYDLGAAWFHDSLTNPVLQEAIRDDDTSLFDYRHHCYYDDKEARVYVSELEGAVDMVGLKVDKVLEDLHKYIELHFMDLLNIKDVSLKQIVAQFFEVHGHMVSDTQKDYAARTMPYLESWFGIPWDLVSGKYSMMDHQGRNLLNTKGYDFIVEKLARGIPNDRTLLGHQVVAIDRDNKNGPHKVSLLMKNGDRVYCNHLIVTVPQSVLQLPDSHPYGIAWSPPLPQNVKEALQSIHFGALGKVIFEFEDVWWDESEDRFDILPDSGAAPEVPLTALPPSFSYYAHVLNYSASHKSNNGSRGSSLGVLLQSPLTEYLEAHRKEAWTYFEPMLSKLVVEGKKVSAPINTITTDWTQNPYIRGSYSALHVDDDPSDLIIQLSGEFDGCGLHENYIRFAGEHTILDGAGCVHGAYASGLREAEWIIDSVAGSV
ncbi:corticosteroid-binding protein [Suhomyces tanzawaensis NRRL Y-17324]|uniref:Corticosteroid-binding protein n=1 Tax=Suhomyces tanzawaensis NRRL Y-17324 TaxID=984487 RepID=A0A1E4SNX1_9ASCO|nr:corticosteroid-binding protein [Suhomyces tanzawaensis NRRL Y-17324]ODV81117.1 corticosteroid-binding protein [Suhomyces tanzawaensis NRRL Y-17324]